MTLILSGTDGVSDIDGTAATPAIRGTDANTGIFFPAADTIAFAEGGAEAMRIDSSGNVGIGVTPSSFATVKAIQLNTASTLMAFTNEFDIGQNIYYNAGNKYITTGAATLYAQTGGQHQWFNAPSGTAGSTITFTQAMTLDASGNVGIGTSSPAALLSTKNGYVRVQAANQTIGDFSQRVGFEWTQETDVQVAKIEVSRPSWSNAPSDMLFFTRKASDGTVTEKMRITEGGVLLVGATTSVGAGAGGIEIKNGSGALTTPLDSWNTATSGNNIFMSFATEGTYTARGNIDYNRGAGQVRYNATSDATLKNIFGDSNGQKSLEILNSTRIREYAWKDDAQQNKQIGVIAQELHETYKGAVSVGGEYEVEIPAVTEQRLVSEAVLDEEGNEIEAAVYETVEIEPSRKETKYRPWAVDKTAFTFHLIAGWQAHEKLLKEAMTRIEALEAQNAAFEARLAALENK